MKTSKLVVGTIAIAIVVGGSIFAYTLYTGGVEGEVTVASVTVSLDTAGPGTSTSMSVLQNYQVGNGSANVQKQNMSRERYRNRWRSQNGTARMKQTRGKGNQGADVSVQITFELQLPNGENRTFSFNPPQSKGMGRKEFQSVLGPNELENKNGTFHLQITIHVTVTPPNMENPVVDKQVTPVNKTFTIPEQQG